MRARLAQPGAEHVEFSHSFFRRSGMRWISSSVLIVAAVIAAGSALVST